MQGNGEKQTKGYVELMKQTTIYAKLQGAKNAQAQAVISEPENLADLAALAKKHGEAAIAATFFAGYRITCQASLRSLMEDTNTIVKTEDAQKLVDEIKLGERRAGGTPSQIGVAKHKAGEVMATVQAEVAKGNQDAIKALQAAGALMAKGDLAGANGKLAEFVNSLPKKAA